MIQSVNKHASRLTPANDTDPREGQSAEIISLATRHVLPAVSQRKPHTDGLGLAAGVAIVALLGGVTFWSLNSASKQAPQARPKAQQAATTAPPFAAPTPVKAPLTDASQQALAAPPPQQAVLSAPPQLSTAPAPGPAPAGNRYASPTVIFDASALPAPFIEAPAANSGSATAGSTGDDFASRIGGVGGSTATAAIAINPKTTVTQGTLIPAVLETAIDTDVPGYVRAVVSADVRSFDGSRVLVPRSSRLIGQYKSGLQAGQKRAYVIWTRLIRPDGVSVNIASPAVGFSGETGLAGKVETHFFERFGSAMLLSVIGGLSSIGGSAGVIMGGSGQSAAAAAIGQSAQIGPTVRVRQGQPIRVFTARDLDFSKVTAQ